MKDKMKRYARIIFPVRYGDEDFPKDFFLKNKDGMIEVFYDLKTGKVLNWDKQRTQANIKVIKEWNEDRNRVSKEALENGILELLDLKVIDSGSYIFYDKNMKEIEKINSYVPSIIPNEWGDYINLTIDLKTGVIKNIDEEYAAKLKSKTSNKRTLGK